MFSSSKILVFIVSAPFFSDAAPRDLDAISLISLPLTTAAAAPGRPDDSLIFPLDSHVYSPSPQAKSNIVDKPLVMAYYPDWASQSLAPEDIDFSRLDWVDFAFALPDKNFALTWDDPDVAPDLLTRLVQTAHAAGKYVKLSIGGWTGSKYFSSAVSTDKNRHTFVSNIVKLYDSYSLDGIDIDWEYPGQQGDPDNLVSSSDTANLLLFLQLLRDQLPVDAKITAATQTVPFAGSDGTPLVDMTEFAQVLDWVLLMNYDTWGSSSTPGPNAPLSDNCNNSTQPSANALAGVDTWVSAGFPQFRIVLGVPAYGYISRSVANSLRNRRHSRSAAYVVAANEEGGTETGQIQFKELVNQGILRRSASSASSFSDGDNGVQFTVSVSPSGMSLSSVSSLDLDGYETSFGGVNGFTRYWDECSSTPFLKSEKAEQVITYDDPESLEMKGRWAKEAGILGVNVFDIHGDTEEWDLVDSVRKGLALI